MGVTRGSYAAASSQTLSTDELRTVVAEASTLVPQRHRQMLLSILDLERVSVNDIMIPRQEIAGIDISMSWDDILDRLRQTPHSRLPVYDGELDKLIGILHMKRVAQELARGTLSRERLSEIAAAREPYFVPDGTPLTQQLGAVPAHPPAAGVRGRRIRRYRRTGHARGHSRGDRRGVHQRSGHREPQGRATAMPQATGWSTPAPRIRALNRSLGWQLPALGPRTLNGLLLEKLETIPAPGTALKIGDYEFEVLQIADNAIRTVRVRAVPRTDETVTAH